MIIKSNTLQSNKYTSKLTDNYLTNEEIGIKLELSEW